MVVAELKIQKVVSSNAVYVDKHIGKRTVRTTVLFFYRYMPCAERNRLCLVAASQT